MNLKEIPGFAEAFQDAHEKSAESRALVWTSASYFLNNGIRQRFITSRALDDLMIGENSIVCGGDPKPKDVANYLWRNCPSFKVNPNLRGKLEDLMIWRRVLKNGHETYLERIYEHLNDAFDETPENLGGSGGGAAGYAYVHDTAYLVDEIASNYGGINPLDIPDLPIKLCFQMLRTIRLRSIPKYTPPNSKRIRLVNDVALQEMDRMNNGGDRN